VRGGRRLVAGLLGLALAGAAPAQEDTAPAADAPLVVRADELWPASGPPLRDAAVVVRGGRVAAVGPAGEVRVPAGARELSGAVVTPGFIDAYTSVGLSGLRNVEAVLDQDETPDADGADLRALDAFHPRAPLLRHLLEHGVTLVQAGPGPRVPVAGQAGLFRTRGRRADDMAVRFPSAVVFNLGETPKQSFGSRGETPTTRMGTAAVIRRRLAAARSRAERGWVASLLADPGAEPGLAVLERALAGELPALFVAHRADDLMTAARIAREFGLRAWLGGATEAYLVPDAVREAGLPLLLGPVMERVAAPERENASYRSPALLAAAGVPFAFRSGFEPYVPRSRLVLFEAAVAVAHGLDPQAALRALTLEPARLLEVDADYGSLEPGKVADLVVFDGDPFEYTSHVQAVVMDGRVVAEPGR